MIDNNNQKPASTNQIENKKPSTMKDANVLSGYVCGSCNAGHIIPMSFYKVRPGQKIYQHNVRKYIKMLTPLTPSYQGVKLTLKAYFVPDTRVWSDAKKYYAQKGGNTVIKTTLKPNLMYGKFETIPDKTNTKAINYFDTTIWRDSWASKYIPRIRSGYIADKSADKLQEQQLPKIDVLPLRGFVAIYNDFERNKEYDTKWQEYNTTTVNQQEIKNYFQGSMLGTVQNPGDVADYNNPRAKRNDSYYTNYRTELMGQNVAEPTTTGSKQISDITEWEKKVAEFRSQAENAQMNDWDIIAKLGGTYSAKQGQVQLLGQKTIGLNYQTVTQTAYNENQNISEEYQSLGTQGAYSFTDININLFNNVEIIENGYIHIIGIISTDTIFETGIDRNLLNVTWDSEYRPDMATLKDDVLYDIETQTTIKEDDGSKTIDETKIIGYKRKYTENFKLPNIINGDICQNPYYDWNIENQTFSYDLSQKTLPQKTYAYGEEYRENNNKKGWKDYSDIYINNNQAVKQKTAYLTGRTFNELMIKGQNQFFYVGKDTVITELPFDPAIKDNFTKWGEM